MKITKKEILDILQEIIIPEDNKSLIHYDILKDLSITNSEIKIKLLVSNPTLQFRKKIEKKINNFITQKSNNYVVDIDFVINKEGNKKNNSKKTNTQY